jgi:ribosomal protein L14E/L6E/L27E
MEIVDKKHVECFNKAKDFVRNELKIEEFVITDKKIENYCFEFDNKFKKVKSELKDHAKIMKEMDLYKIQSNSLTKLDFRKPI